MGINYIFFSYQLLFFFLLFFFFKKLDLSELRFH